MSDFLNSIKEMQSRVESLEFTIQSYYEELAEEALGSTKLQTGDEISRERAIEVVQHILGTSLLQLFGKASTVFGVDDSIFREYMRELILNYLFRDERFNTIAIGYIKYYYNIQSNNLEEIFNIFFEKELEKLNENGDSNLSIESRFEMEVEKLLEVIRYREMENPMEMFSYFLVQLKSFVYYFDPSKQSDLLNYLKRYFVENEGMLDVNSSTTSELNRLIVRYCLNIFAREFGK